jgi:hypothetical protein
MRCSSSVLFVLKSQLESESRRGRERAADVRIAQVDILLDLTRNGVERMKPIGSTMRVCCIGHRKKSLGGLSATYRGSGRTDDQHHRSAPIQGQGVTGALRSRRYRRKAQSPSPRATRDGNERAGAACWVSRQRA